MNFTSVDVCWLASRKFNYESHRNGVNLARNQLVERDFITLGADPECERLPLQIFIDAGGCDSDGRGSGVGYVIANSGVTQVEWKDGWSHDEAIYNAISRGIEDVPSSVEVLFLVDSGAVVNYFENDAPGRKQREMLRFLARTQLRMKERGLTVTVARVSRKQNLARHLLDDPTP